MAKAHYEEDFKKRLVDLYLLGVNISYICKEYGILHRELYQWIDQYAEEKSESTEVNNFLQLRELRIQKVKLEKEVSLLNEAIDFLENP
ncbi:transposase [Listeria welshimeri]|uniref:transposase n=1 Tax=Listeria welshimeri TaxID=1643 RepID=UPI001629C01A|nr:transposase [Listeria welshimeri]MBC1244337.1 transposase [Listeria welshimeri]MBC1253040.1 transposase [Listeria welshimeri]MBC1364878.1 transposase [Listeria welshimeri]MBC1370454.1 transposase [Listeria welshimeri]MBC1391153.1 transposase [Listeria welshimeri]